MPAAVTAIVHFVLTLIVVLGLAVGWAWFTDWRFDVPVNITDKDIDADLHHH